MTAAASLHLYEHADALDVVREWILEPEHQEALVAAEGDLAALPELQQLLELAEMDFKVKAERVALVARERALTAKAIGEEIERLTALKKSAESAERGLKAYLKFCLERVGLTRVDGTLARVALQKNSQPSVTTALQANELYALPEAQRFVTREETVIYSLDRAAILAAWKEGQALPASIVVEQGCHIRIR